MNAMYSDAKFLFFLYNDIKWTDQTYSIDVFMYMCIQKNNWQTQW